MTNNTITIPYIIQSFNCNYGDSVAKENNPFDKILCREQE